MGRKRDGLKMVAGRIGAGAPLGKWRPEGIVFGAAGDWGRIGASNVTRAQAVSIFETGRFHLRDRIGAR